MAILPYHQPTKKGNTIMGNDNEKWNAYYEEQDRLANGEKICDRCGKWHKNKSGYNQFTFSWYCKECESLAQLGIAECACCGEGINLDKLHENSLDIPEEGLWSICHYGATLKTEWPHDDPSCADDVRGWVSWLPGK